MQKEPFATIFVIFFCYNKNDKVVLILLQA